MENLVIGRMVHYKDYDASRSLRCIVAFVTRVVTKDAEYPDRGIVHLHVLYTTGAQDKQNVQYGASEDQETWHWPLRQGS